MAWAIINPSLGFPPITDHSTTAAVALGTVVRAVDPTYGHGEFIYLKGVANTVVGSWVSYNPEGYTTALLAANAIGPVAVAMSACVADEYGWYQRSGTASVKAADVSDSGNVYTDTDVGIADDAVVTGDRVHGAKWASDDDTSGYALATITYPYVDDGLGGGST